MAWHLHPMIQMRRIAKNIAFLIATLLLAWWVLGLLGFQMALGASLAASMVLTLALYLLSSVVRRRR